MGKKKTRTGLDAKVGDIVQHGDFTFTVKGISWEKGVKYLHPFKNSDFRKRPCSECVFIRKGFSKE